MADPTIFGRPMRCYNPGRGWELDVWTKAGLTIAAYIERMPGVGGTTGLPNFQPNKTRIWLSAMVWSGRTDFPYSEISGLDEHAAARIAEGLLRGFAAELIQGER